MARGDVINYFGANPVIPGAGPGSSGSAASDGSSTSASDGSPASPASPGQSAPLDLDSGNLTGSFSRIVEQMQATRPQPAVHPDLDRAVTDDSGRFASHLAAAREAAARQSTPTSPDELTRTSWVEIDLGAISHNVRVAAKRLGPGKKLMAVVKADAYGHGAVPVAKTALKSGATHLAVATTDEAVELRLAGITAPILVLAEPPARAIPTLLAYRIMPTVTTAEFALKLGEAADAQGTVAKYHLAIDTGMNRIGVYHLDVVDFLQQIGFHRGLALDGVFTHFATSDEATDWEFRKQLSRFNEALQLLQNARIDTGIVHSSNSAATLRYPEAHFDMGRLGISMYGVAPSPEMRPEVSSELRPAMSVKARISYIHEPQIGEGVSYGLNYRVAKPVQIATVPIGYADGLRRSLSGKMRVLVNGRVCRQVGNICMDQMMVEIPLERSVDGREGGASIGDEVVIIGRQGGIEVTADMMADELGTIDHEVMCLFALRLPKIYIGD